MSTLANAKLVSLKEKLEAVEVAKAELEKVEDEVKADKKSKKIKK